MIVQVRKLTSSTGQKHRGRHGRVWCKFEATDGSRYLMLCNSKTPRIVAGQLLNVVPVPIEEQQTWPEYDMEYVISHQMVVREDRS